MTFSITPEGYVEIELTDDMYNTAEQHAVNIGVLNNSHRKGDGNIVGTLGEQAVLTYLNHLGLSGASTQSFNNDIAAGGLTFEVKTKDRTVVPKGEYYADLAAYNTGQKADTYVFVSLLRNPAGEYTHAYITGVETRDDYMAKAVFRKKGDPDGPMFKVKFDCYSVLHRDLTRFSL